MQIKLVTIREISGKKTSVQLEFAILAKGENVLGSHARLTGRAGISRIITNWNNGKKSYFAKMREHVNSVNT